MSSLICHAVTYVLNCCWCHCCCHQVILEEAFPDLVEAGSGVDVRTAIEAPGNLQQVRQHIMCSALCGLAGGNRSVQMR
jgi:hypothetical protein